MAINTFPTPVGNESISIGFGQWRGNLDGGTDTLFASADFLTVTGGTGSDSLFVHWAQAQITLGGGSDTVFLSGSDATLKLGGGDDQVGMVFSNTELTAGNGNDSIKAEFGGRHSIVTGNGSDTVFLSKTDAIVRVGHGHDQIDAFRGSYTIQAPIGGNDTITASFGSFNIQARGHDSVFVTNGHGKVVVIGGHDTIAVKSFSGVVDDLGNGGHDLVTVNTATANMVVNGGFDTIAVGGAIDLKANGQNDLITFEDEHGLFNNTFSHALKFDAVTAPGHNDTFVYDYPAAANHGASEAKGVGAAEIIGFNHSDDLQFHGDLTHSVSLGGLEAHSTVVDHGQGHNVVIHILTSTGHNAGTIVLKGIGTKHHIYDSLAVLAAHYNLSFS
jgi:hypothetical protein